MLGLRIGARCPAASSGNAATAAQSSRKIDLTIASPRQRLSPGQQSLLHGGGAFGL